MAWTDLHEGILGEFAECARGARKSTDALINAQLEARRLRAAEWWETNPGMNRRYAREYRARRGLRETPEEALERKRYHAERNRVYRERHPPDERTRALARERKRRYRARLQIERLPSIVTPLTAPSSVP